MKRVFLFLSLLLSAVLSVAQAPVAEQVNASPAITSELLQKENVLRQEFAAKNLIWPARQVYIRSFKYDSQLEVWVRNNNKDTFQLFKTYKVCVMAGTIGPKRIEGDYQVPEGFYYIDEFNPRSEYHLSLKLNYPNESDKILSDQLKPGGGIYIHGECVSVGCIPLQNDQIDELYLITSAAKSNGQSIIPVHIFPIQFDNPKSIDYYTKFSFNDIPLQHFSITLKSVYDYFQANKKLPLIGIDKEGYYDVLN